MTSDPTDGSPVVNNYTPSKFDRANIVNGLAAIAKLCYLEGARVLVPAVPVPSFQFLRPVQERQLSDRDFVEWLHLLETESIEPL